MLLELKVLNGEMTPKFDKYNNIYTININTDIERLELDFKVEDNYNVNIIDNNSFIEGENIVTIEVYNDTDINKYTLIVNKELSKQVFSYKETIKEEKEVLPEYVAPIIISTCFILIFIFFIIIFRTKKK